jgi:F-type H+-transporting ATPase subunit a
MHHQLWFTDLLNRFFGGAANALLGALGIHAHDPANPITNVVGMQILVALIMLAFFVMVRTRLSVEQPGKTQFLMESIYGFFDKQAHEVIGHHYERYVPYLITLGLFILIGNLLGLVPSFMSPTMTPYVPLGCALATFIYYNGHGFRHHGTGYVAHFAGPVWWMSWLLFPIEIISHSARIMSLTIRLYANMFAGEMVTLAFFSLVPVFVPLIFLGLHVLVAVVQTLIFVLLTMAYLQGAVADEH